MKWCSFSMWCGGGCCNCLCYNEILKTKPASLNPLSLSKFRELMRMEVAMSGYTEEWLRFCVPGKKFHPCCIMKKITQQQSVQILVIWIWGCSDYSHVWLLNTVGHSKDHPKPIKTLEVGDIVHLDDTKDVGAENCRHLSALYYVVWT